jgi:hypothetical protein
MSSYTLALFLHISGALGAGVSLGVWLLGLAALRRAQQVEQVRAVAWLIIVVSPLMVLSILLIVGSGLTMALGTWGLRTGWIMVALSSLALMAPIGPLLLDARMRTILAMAGVEAGGPIPDPLVARIHDPIMGAAARTLAAMLLGIVFLMTTKPALGEAIVAMLTALLLGLAAGLPLWRAPQFPIDSAHVDSYLRKTFWTRRW